MRRIFLLFYLFSFCFLVHPQSREIDSLRNLLYTAKEDTSRILLTSIFTDRYHLYDPDTSLKMTREALALAQSIDYPKGEAYVKRVMADILRNMGDYSTPISLV